jgi:hypothetical protein
MAQQATFIVYARPGDNMADLEKGVCSSLQGKLNSGWKIWVRKPPEIKFSWRACCRIRVGVIPHHYIDAIRRGNHYILIFADKIFDCATGSGAASFRK